MNNNAKYARGKIYTIRSHKTNLIYVGSTIEPYLSTRMRYHWNGYKRYKNGKGDYTTSFDVLQLDENCYIELYEDYPCNNRRELEKREGEIIRSLDCVNKRIEGRTRNEWYEDNKEHISEYRKQYREDNKEKIKAKAKQHYETHKEEINAKNKQYRENNKEKINAKAKQKYNCECGGKYTLRNKAQHMKSKKHRDYMEFTYN